MRQEPSTSARPLTDAEELLREANKDLPEAETIAESGSMLIWQIEAALKRAWLYLILASANSASLRLNPYTDEGENAESQRTQSDWLTMAREKLEQTKTLIHQPKPHEPMTETWETLVAFKKSTSSVTTSAT